MSSSWRKRLNDLLKRERVNESKCEQGDYECSEERDPSACQCKAEGPVAPEAIPGLSFGDATEASLTFGNSTETPPELDPSGKDQHEDGAKCDAGKVELSYLEYFPKALRAVCLVSMFGTKKYSRGGWIHVKDGQRRYRDAQFRHMLSDNGFADSDSGLPHAAHAAWNALAVLELELSKGLGLLEAMQSTVAEGREK